ncbi:MAG: polysaccharide deacetylase family protein [Armatimonadota bacterium]
MRKRTVAVCLVGVAALLLVLGGCRPDTAPPEVDDEGESAEASLEAPAEPVSERKIVTLCYHSMAAESGSTYEIETADFEEQLQALADDGYESVLPAQIADYLEGKADLPDRSVCITFDDGPESVLTVSKPLMDEHGFVGAAFLIADSIGAEGKLTWDQARELEAAGWEIGSHTSSHQKPTKVGAEALRAELEDSRATIAAEIEGECEALAYPFGLYDASVVEHTRDAGYRIAFTIDRGPADQTTDPMLVPRQMLVNGNSLNTFRGWLAQEKLHLEEIEPAVGERVGVDATVTARLGDEDVPVDGMEMSVNGAPISYEGNPETGELTIYPELNAGANNLRVNHYGSPRREMSWVIVAE